MTTPAKPVMGTLHACSKYAPDLGSGDGQQITEAQMFTCPVCGRNWVSWVLMDRGSRPKSKWVSTSLPGSASLPTQVAAAVAATSSAASAQQLSALTTQVAALTSAVAAAQAQATALAARTVQPRQAQAPVLAIAIGGKLDVAATWDTAWPDTNYLYDVLVPAALIGKVTVAEKSRTASTVVLTLTASQLVVTGSTLNLIGVRWA